MCTEPLTTVQRHEDVEVRQEGELVGPVQMRIPDPYVPSLCRSIQESGVSLVMCVGVQRLDHEEWTLVVGERLRERVDRSERVLAFEDAEVVEGHAEDEPIARISERLEGRPGPGRRHGFGDREGDPSNRNLAHALERFANELGRDPHLVDVVEAGDACRRQVRHLPEAIGDHPVGRSEQFGMPLVQDRELVGSHHGEGGAVTDAVVGRERRIDRGTRRPGERQRRRGHAVFDERASHQAPDVSQRQLLAEISDDVHPVAERLFDRPCSRTEGSRCRLGLDGLRRIAREAPPSS